MSYDHDKDSWAIQRSLDQQEAEANRGLTPQEEEAMDSRLIDCPGCAIPEATKEALERFVYQGIPTGAFLRAVLENNFLKAVALADPANFVALKQIGEHVYSCLPDACHGSSKAVNQWLGEMGGW